MKNRIANVGGWGGRAGLALALALCGCARPTAADAPAAPIAEEKAPASGLLFHASFDAVGYETLEPVAEFRSGRPGEYPAADFAAGDPLPDNVRNVKPLLGEGRFGGDAALVTGVPGGSRGRPGATILSFDGLGNLQTRRGTVAFWVRSEAPLWSGTYRGGRHPKIFLARDLQIPSRPHNKFLNLGVNFHHKRIEVQGFEGWSWHPEEEWAPKEWHHLAITWDAATGKRLFHNGIPVLDVDAPMFRSRWIDVFNFASQLGGGCGINAVELGFAYDQFYIFDYALTPEQIRRLAETNEAPARRNELTEEDRRKNMEWLSEKFGWDRDGLPEHQEGAVLRATRVFPDRVRSGTIDTSLPVDGKVGTFWPIGYKDTIERERLSFYFPEGAEFDYVRIRGSRHESRRAGEYEPGYAHVYYHRTPGGAEGRFDADGRSAAFDGRRLVQSARFAESVKAAKSVFVRPAPREGAPIEAQRRGIEESLINQIDFYRLESVPDRPLPNGRTAFLRPLLRPDAEEAGEVGKAVRAAYPPEDRTVFVCQQEAPTTGKTPVEAGHFLHFATEPFEGAAGVGALELLLALDGFSGPVRMSVQVRDPVTMRRELAEFDLKFDGKGAAQDVRLRFDGLDYIFTEGQRLWVIAVFDSPGTVLSGPQGSRLTLAGDPANGGRSYVRRLEQQLSDAFLWISEPQPWRAGGPANIGGDPFRQIKPLAEIMTLAEHIQRIDPENWTANSIYSFILTRGRPRWRRDVVERFRNKDPFADLELADVVDYEERGDAPDWAFYGREALRMERQIVDWWVNERMDERTGLMGGGLGDDTTLVPGFVNFALIHDPGDRIRKGIRRLTEYAWEHRMQDGISTTVRSALHVYEEGTNAVHLLPRLFYGDPRAIEMVLRTSRHYDGHITGVNRLGQRLRRSVTFSATEIPGPDSPFFAPYDHGMARTYHPGRVLVWYNRHPEVLRVLQDWAETWLEFGQVDGTAPCVGHRARYFETGEPVEGVSAPADQMNFHLYWLYETTREQRYYDALTAGWRPMSFPRWRVQNAGRDSLLDTLKSGIVNTYKQLPVQTWVGQSTDRIIIRDVPIARMYLGDSAQTNKRQGWHFHAVSWEGADNDVSRFVVDNREDGLKVLIYSFHDDPKEVTMRPWRLQHGRYRVRGGPDVDGSEAPGPGGYSREQILFRYEPVTFTVPPRQVYVLEIEQLKVIPERIETRPDLAVGQDDVSFEGGAIRARVHNIGSSPSLATAVHLLRNGQKVAERRLPALAAPYDLRMKTHEVVFENVEPGGRLEVVVDPENRVPEITTVNNRVEVKAVGR